MIKKIFYEDIYLVQSYPAINSVMNQIHSTESSTLIIVVGNKSLEKFFCEIMIGKSNVKIIRFGSYDLLYSRIKKLFYPLHLILLRLFVKSYSCKNLIVTFKDWGDIGLIQLRKIKSINNIYLNVFENHRYEIKDRKPHSLYDFVYYLFHRILIGKNLSLKLTYPVINRKFPLIGITDAYYKNSNFEEKMLNKIEINKDIIKNYIDAYVIKNDGVIFIEKDLISNDIVSKNEYWKFIKKLVNEINTNNLEVYLKFKPRNFNKSLESKYLSTGMKTLPYYVPIQFFYGHPKLISGIGFTSSAMSYNENFNIVSFAKAIKLNSAAKVTVNRSIDSTLGRSKSKIIKFPNSIEEIIEELIK